MGFALKKVWVMGYQRVWVMGSNPPPTNLVDQKMYGFIGIIVGRGTDSRKVIS